MYVVHGRDEVARLIKQAMMLADEYKLSLVSIHLEAARVALDAEQGTPVGASRESGSANPTHKLALPRDGAGCNVVELHAPGSLEQLLIEHKTLEARRQSLLDLTTQSANAIEAEKQLREFSSLIEAHRATERRCVYGPLLARKVSVNGGLDEKLKGMVNEIDSDWNRYLHSWDRDKIAKRWDEFSFITRSILARAGERMRLEERVIYPLAFLSGSISLEEPAE